MAAPLTGPEVLARDCATSLARLVAVGTLMERASRPKPTPYELLIEARYPCRCVGECRCEDEDRFEWSFPCSTVFEALELLRTEYVDGQVLGYGSPMDVTFVRLSARETGVELFGWTSEVKDVRWPPVMRERLADELDEWEAEYVEASS